MVTLILSHLLVECKLYTYTRKLVLPSSLKKQNKKQKQKQKKQNIDGGQDTSVFNSFPPVEGALMHLIFVSSLDHNNTEFRGKK